MKKVLIIIAFFCFTTTVHAQSFAINTDGSDADANAILDVKSGTKGMLIPRMDAAARLSIPNTKGLLVYDTSTNSFWYNTGAIWKNLDAAATGWSITGNTGTFDGTNFIGTTDNVPLSFRINNQKAGKIDQIGTTFFGYQAGNSNSVSSNTAFGFRALYFNTSGPENTAVGIQSLYFNSSGSRNTAFGNASLFSNTIGFQNTAVGFQSLNQNGSGSSNTAIGFGSLFHNISASANTAIGYSALYWNMTGEYNTANGYNSLFNNSTGSNNTASGFYSLDSNSTGSNNTASGLRAMHYNKTGSFNTSLGVYALETNLTGGNNTALGSFADVMFDGITKSTALGYNSKVSASSNLILGGIGADAVNVGIGVTAANSTLVINGTFATTISTQAGSGTVTLNNSAAVWYFSGTASIQLPAAGTCTSRRYNIVNITGADKIISTYTNLFGTSSTLVNANTGIEIISDGVNWLQIK